jgi:soluble lytic murein transglycosylase-like protein
MSTGKKVFLGICSSLVVGLLLFSLLVVHTIWPFIFVMMAIGFFFLGLRADNNRILIGMAVMLLVITFIATWDRVNQQSIPVVEAAAPAVTASPATTPAGSSSNSEAKTSYTLALPDNIAPWCGLIEASAAKYGVNPKLIAAVMLQESGGQADVISASGAVGLLQVMPRDGLAASFMCANGPCFAGRPSTQELLDPAFNVDYGVRMLANLITKNGSEREALKAYGPYNIGYYYADKVLAIKANL